VLTPAGGRALDSALGGHLESLDRHLVAPLGPAGVATLTDLLRTLRDASTTGTSPAGACPTQVDSPA
jgi:hypothetical protein